MATHLDELEAELEAQAGDLLRILEERDANTDETRAIIAAARREHADAGSLSKECAFKDIELRRLIGQGAHAEV